MAPCSTSLDLTHPSSDAEPCLTGLGPDPHLVGLGPGEGVALVAMWIAVGVTCAVVLAKRGHDLRSLVGLAVVLGPLFLPLAVGYVRDRDPHTRPIELVPTPEGAGRRAIVVVLGSPEAAADALPVLDRIEGIGRVTLGMVIDYESARRREWDDRKQEAERRLQRAAILLGDHEPGLVLMPGTVERGLADIELDREDVILLVGDSDTPGAERLSGVTGAPVVSVPASNRH